MKMEIPDIMAEVTKVLGGATAGIFGGMWAERRAAKFKAAKSEAVEAVEQVQELQPCLGWVGVDEKDRCVCFFN